MFYNIVYIYVYQFLFELYIQKYTYNIYEFFKYTYLLYT